MRRRAGPILFGLALVVLAALVVHWNVLIWRHESSSISLKEHAVTEQARVEAQLLGASDTPPKLGVLKSNADVEVVRLGAGKVPARTFRLLPAHGSLGVRPSSKALDRLRDQRKRRMAMIVGEGALAVLLLCVLVIMLWRLLRVERQRRREIEAFIGTVSHELKTPLAGIKALLGTLEAGHIPEERLKEFLDMGLREADRLEHLVENILLHNRIRRETLAVQLGSVDLASFLAEYLKHRSGLLPDGHAGITLGGEPLEGLGVRADADKLRVVLENLTDNAVKYGPDGAVRLAVQTTDPHIVLHVEDQGVGFDPAQAEALFSGVVPVGQEGRPLVHGTGLGLGIARELTRAMGGELTAHSEGPGRGSRFSVRLERCALPEEAEA